MYFKTAGKHGFVDNTGMKDAGLICSMGSHDDSESSEGERVRAGSNKNGVRLIK